MADKGPFLTACIIFYLSIGAAIFQILEEPNWTSAKDNYLLQKKNILQKYKCLSKEALDEILEIVAGAAGQGVAITGDKHRNTWDWGNSVIFAATIVTTIGYGNVAPKTQHGRIFCILYGLCGIPLCLVWISKLGSFFGDWARRLSQVLIRKGVSVRKVQFTCTACFLLWGLIVHLLIPPFVFMSLEKWTYLEGLYFSFITLTTVGFGDYVAGVNPEIQYPRLYRVLAEVWIYMGLAWLSLFFSWNVHMVVKAHQVFRKRRKHRPPYEEESLLEVEEEEEDEIPEAKPTVIDIFKFLSDTNEDDYNTVMGQIAIDAKKAKPPENINRSKSCSDIFDIQPLEQSPRRKRRISSAMFLKVPPSVVVQKEADKEENNDNKQSTEREDDKSGSNAENGGIIITVPVEPSKTENIQSPTNGESRFKITKVVETDLLVDKEGKG